MTVKSAKILLWPTVLALVAGLLLPLPADALRVNIQRQGDSDKMVFSFDSNKLPEYSVRRDGKQSLVITLPADVWKTEARPGDKDFPGKLVQSIRVSGNTVLITTRTNAFGFIRVPVAGKSQFLLQLYRDPIGSRWKPAKAEPPATPTLPPAKPVQPRPRAATPVEKPLPAAVPSAQPETPGADVPTAQSAQPVATQVEADLPPEQRTTGDRKPFFSVPYSVRTEVTPPPGQGQPVAVPSSPGVSVDKLPSTNELRFKAVNKTAEEVKFAELAGSKGHVADVPVSAAQSTDGVSGSVVPPPGDVPTPQPVDAEPVQQTGDAVSGGVAPAPEEPPVVLQPLVMSKPVSGAGQVGGGVVAPPPSVVEGAPPPEPTPEEAASVVQPPPVEVVQDQTPQDQVAQSGSDTAADAVKGVDDVAVDNATQEAQARQEEIKNQLYEAQTMMFNGNLPEALEIYEKILRMPGVDSAAREETLYAVADIKRQLNRDNLAAKFDEIAQGYIEAMNANLHSSKVPSALLNLGLINLQVGNFPEAKAYFKILQEKYPDDDNIPSISYYWGEYYYKKGDYKKAADQFQYLIQTYPEHELVKRAAFYLADSLNRTGFYEQAFQIVDYIDKRWPDYYMENTEFLRLAGGVEMRLGKWAAAKNHYFTFYNLNPEAKGSDIVLARIGDIYIREGEKQAARQIYEKAVQDFPTQEGGAGCQDASGRGRYLRRSDHAADGEYLQSSLQQAAGKDIPGNRQGAPG